MKGFGVTLASEAKTRAEATELLGGENLVAEAAPLTHTLSSGGVEIRPSAFVYVPELWEKIVQMIEANAGYKMYIHQLLRFLERINLPGMKEPWLKVGGDKGGCTFKMSFQLGNVENPNSPDNTSVFSIFEGPDTCST